MLCIRSQIGALIVTIMSLFCCTNVFADDEKPLQNVVISAYVNPIGAPQAFLDKDIKHPHGLDVDILLELQKRLGFNFAENRIYPLDLKLAFARVKSGEADILGGGISYTEQRALSYDYTPIFYKSSMTVLYDKERMSGKVSLNDFKGKKLGFLIGSTSEEFIKKLGAQAVGVSSNIFGYFAVSSGAIDGYLYDRPPLAAFARQVPSLHLDVIDERFGEDLTQFAFVLPKDSPYTELFSAEIEKMQEDGTIDKILSKWNAD